MTDKQLEKAIKCWTGTIVSEKECMACPYSDKCTLEEIANEIIHRWRKCKAENAALRERLEKAEIPCHIGDTLYEPFVGTIIREWVVESIHIGFIGVTVNCHRKDDYKWHDSFAVRKHYNDFGEKGRVCFTREAAEARLAELKGGKE